MFSIWLVPSMEDSDYLNKIITKLSNIYNTPLFMPHCTLWSKVKLAQSQLCSIIETSIKGIKPFSIKVTGSAYSQSYSKTLFLNLEKNKLIYLLYDRIQNELSNNFHDQFDPHISLIYNKTILSRY